MYNQHYSHDTTGYWCGPGSGAHDRLEFAGTGYGQSPGKMTWFQRGTSKAISSSLDAWNCRSGHSWMGISQKWKLVQKIIDKNEHIFLCMVWLKIGVPRDFCMDQEWSRISTFQSLGRCKQAFQKGWLAHTIPLFKNPQAHPKKVQTLSTMDVLSEDDQAFSWPTAPITWPTPLLFGGWIWQLPSSNQT